MYPYILTGHSRPLTMVKFNEDGDLIFSCAKDKVPTLWYASNGQRVGTYDGHKGTVWALDVSYNSKILITAGADMTVKIWEVESGKMLCDIPCSGPVRHVEFNEGCTQFAAICDPFMKHDTCVRIYTLPKDLYETMQPFKECNYIEWEQQNFTANKNRLTKLLWLPCNDGIITGDINGFLRIHNVETGAVEKEIKEQRW